jgi:hypothetical protein
VRFPEWCLLGVIVLVVVLAAGFYYLGQAFPAECGVVL